MNFREHSVFLGPSCFFGALHAHFGAFYVVLDHSMFFGALNDFDGAHFDP